MELPDEYKQTQVGGERVILIKGKKREYITLELCLNCYKQAGLNLRNKRKHKYKVLNRVQYNSPVALLSETTRKL